MPETMPQADVSGRDNLVRMEMDTSLLEAALAGYLARRNDIDAKIAEIRMELGGSAPVARAAVKGRTISAAVRKRMAEGQKKRWAAYRASAGAPAKKAPRQKRQLSPAAIKRISDATKKRWAAYHASKTKASNQES